MFATPPETIDERRGLYIYLLHSIYSCSVNDDMKRKRVRTDEINKKINLVQRLTSFINHFHRATSHKKNSGWSPSVLLARYQQFATHSCMASAPRHATRIHSSILSAGHVHFGMTLRDNVFTCCLLLCKCAVRRCNNQSFKSTNTVPRCRFQLYL